ncbi:ABC transporter permease [Streptomyces sp. WAC 01420]|uniref:FtsX-like permease family protein n=2 Tax=unclassified Streptomyces TaxID=2593676 RepID=UPI000F6D441D|nr:FtsX-like permease family protein [Streptomyces sp. WAC 01438]AZM62683.1 ABC transporter permease [Streptomyces sp. WAC 01438]RSM89917.1 ABC transporter permease [Streptomyces sp. WAC 01420]
MRTPWRATVLGSQVAELLRRPGRSAATGVSLLIAAFVVFGAVTAQQIIGATVVDTFRGTPEAVSVVVTPGDEEELGEDRLRVIRGTPGVTEAVGRIEGGAPLGGSAVERYLTLSADPGSGALAEVRLVEGTYPSGPDRLAVNTEAARDFGLAPGSSLVLLQPDTDGESTRRVEVEVSGIVRSTATDDAEPTGYAPGPALRELLGVSGYSRIDIGAGTASAASGDGAPLAERIRQAVPGAQVRSGDAVRDEEARAAVAEARDTLELVSVFLAVAVGAAVLVATSTFRIVFTRRVRQLALLRTIGATPRRLAAALVAEGAAVGLLAGTIGVLAAWACGQLVPPVADRLGHDLTAPAQLPPAEAVLTVLGTGLLAVLAVLAPSLSAARVSPLEALRSAASDEDGRATGIGRTLLGLLCAAGAALLARQQYGGLPEPGDGDYDRFAALTAVVLSGGLAFLALIALGPLLVRPVLSALAVPLRRAGAAGRLAVAGVGGAPRRAASVSVVVALGVCLVGSTLTCLASLEAYARYRQAVETPADFQLYPRDSDTLDRDLAADLARRPELAGVTAFRRAEVVEGTRTATISDLDLGTVRSGTGLTARTGSLDRLGPGRVVVDAEAAHDLDVRAGDRVTLTFEGRPVQLTVAATLPGAGPYGGEFFVTAADLTRMGADPAPTTVTADAAEDGAQGRIRAQRAITGTLTGPERGEGRVIAEDTAAEDTASDDLRTTATMAVLVLGLTVLVAVAGVATTASLTVVERKREFGLLRALGLGGAAVHRMVTVECALHGALGGLLGLALGVPYSWLVVRVAEASAPFTVPVGQLSAVFTALVLVTAAAGTVPALRASRTSPTVAVARSD